MQPAEKTKKAGVQHHQIFGATQVKNWATGLEHRGQLLGLNLDAFSFFPLDHKLQYAV
jgi:hypothetical protein